MTRIAIQPAIHRRHQPWYKILHVQVLIAMALRARRLVRRHQHLGRRARSRGAARDHDASAGDRRSAGARRQRV